MTQRLEALQAGMIIPYGGDRFTTVPADLAAAFKPGDRLLIVPEDGALLHIPAEVQSKATDAVGRAHAAFQSLGAIGDEAITAFYDAFAERLADSEAFAAIAVANRRDVERATERGRSTTRLELSARMRSDMIAGLQSWRDAPSGRGKLEGKVEHDGWQVEQVRAGLGVVGFVFEGRPNVFADATGVLRSGNSVVFRIGSDALQTAMAIVEHALEPALAKAGLPAGTVSLVASPARAAGWAMFSDARLSLAVARGSGNAVSQLGAVARQAGIPVSLHGTGGAWIVAGQGASAQAFGDAVYASLDRKVCNTLNTCCVLEAQAKTMVPVFLAALKRAGERRGVAARLHATESALAHVPEAWRQEVEVGRAEGLCREPATTRLDIEELGREWEWEDSPEVSLHVVADVAEASQLFNRLSPRFVVSLISDDSHEAQRFFERVDAPFVGNAFTRWVDGQYALNRPELGLSNWQQGRLFGRGGILSGDSVFTVRTRAIVARSDMGR